MTSTWNDVTNEVTKQFRSSTLEVTNPPSKFRYVARVLIQHPIYSTPSFSRGNFGHRNDFRHLVFFSIFIYFQRVWKTTLMFRKYMKTEDHFKHRWFPKSFFLYWSFHFCNYLNILWIFPVIIICICILIIVVFIKRCWCHCCGLGSCHKL